MQVVFNPKDTNTFASCSLDHQIKVWQLGATAPNFTLAGHEKGVNCIDYFPVRPFIPAASPLFQDVCFSLSWREQACIFSGYCQGSPPAHLPSSP